MGFIQSNQISSEKIRRDILYRRRSLTEMKPAVGNADFSESEVKRPFSVYFIYFVFFFLHLN